METTEETTKESAKSTVKTEAPHPGGVRRLKKTVTWQRVTGSAIGVAVMLVVWQWATWHLYSLSPAAFSSFTTITVNCFYVIGAIVIFFVTGKLIYDMKVDTVSQVITEGRRVFERRDENIVSEHTEIIVDETARNQNLREHQE